MNQEKLPLSRSIWFSWFLSTATYLLFNSLGIPYNGTDTVLELTAGILGLFVPYGLMSLMAFMHPGGWISLIVFFISMNFAEKTFKKMNLNFGKKIFFNFIALLIITTIIDLIRFTPFMSWVILFDGLPF